MTSNERENGWYHKNKLTLQLTFSALICDRHSKKKTKGRTIDYLRSTNVIVDYSVITEDLWTSLPFWSLFRAAWDFHPFPSSSINSCSGFALREPSHCKSFLTNWVKEFCCAPKQDFTAILIWTLYFEPFIAQISQLLLGQLTVLV